LATKRKKAPEAAPEEQDGPFLSAPADPVAAGSPSSERTSVRVEEGRAYVTVERPDEPLTSDELHNLRRQCEAAYIEVT
jgi:hypothetical protein